MSRKVRSAVVAFALANLLVSAAFALPGGGRSVLDRTPGVSAAWEWLVGLFVPAVTPVRASGRGMVAKAGSRMDPDGAPNYSGSTTDAGSQMDPNGLK